jgi:hypothetical protein
MVTLDFHSDFPHPGVVPRPSVPAKYSPPVPGPHLSPRPRLLAEYSPKRVTAPTYRPTSTSMRPPDIADLGDIVVRTIACAATLFLRASFGAS